MKYNIYRKTLKDVYGDSAWLQPVYSYKFIKTIHIDNPISVGDYVEGNKVIQIEHNEEETKVITNE